MKELKNIIKGFVLLLIDLYFGSLKRCYVDKASSLAGITSVDERELNALTCRISLGHK